MTGVTVNLFFDTRKQKRSGKFPVKLTIYFLDDKKRYKTGVDLSEESWKKINSSNLKDASLKTIKMKLDAIVSSADKIIDGLNSFSFELFESKFFQPKQVQKSCSFYELFETYIKNLKKEERLKTASSYNTTLNALKKNKSNLKVTEVTFKFLEEYEANSKELGHSNTTIGINLRNIRAIINYAIKEGQLKQEQYPFKGYKIPKGRNVKKALEWKDIQALLKYQPKDVKQDKALDLWKFSYLCNGMNLADIALLRTEHISGNFLQFLRKKTIRTSKTQIPIRVALHPMAIEIIRKWKQPDNPYLFAVLSPGLPAVTRKNRTDKLIKMVNDNIQPIMNELGISLTSVKRVTSYAARHSFATTLKRKGVSTDEISEYLGHADVATTKNYLDSFEDSLLVERSKLLVE